MTATTTRPTTDDRQRTPREVKRMLTEIAYVLRLTQDVKREILANAQPTARSAAHAGTASAACAL